MESKLTDQENSFLQRAIELSEEGMAGGHGGPFGCIVVKDGSIIGEGYNRVLSSNDPTAHAEIVAIRMACTGLQSFQLEGCDIYTSCEPCPMCLGAIYWARPARVIYANTREEAAAIEFDDDFIYHEISASMMERKIPFLHVPHPVAKEIFGKWARWEGKKQY